jgi:hypothetical protein
MRHEMEAGRLQSELALKIPILLTLPRSRQREKRSEGS